ncbi:MAG: biotin-dependent carboxyltransferase family protein [Planctomycetia bacterium]|nr:biotin-dependent carboxyltransferase family protein [Planctomycetia bacterium]
MSLLVLEAGLQSLLVDFGRPRSRSLGVPVGGAADRAALALGNALVGNSPDALALEVILSGPTLEARHPTACVIFGAPFQSTVNEKPLAVGTTFTLEAGDVLRVGGTQTGARAYLCVAGGFDSPEVLKSRSALEAIRAGDTLACRASRIEPRSLPFITGPPPQPPSLQGGGRKALSLRHLHLLPRTHSLLSPPPCGRGRRMGGWVFALSMARSGTGSPTIHSSRRNTKFRPRAIAWGFG